MPQPKQRPYYGYEDYSPEGRAAIGGFNSAKGPHFLHPSDPIEQYQAAVEAAKIAAMVEAIKRRQEALNLGQMQGTEEIPAIPPYQYPPR